MSKIRVRNLTKRYGSATALDNVSLDIESGEFLVLLGAFRLRKNHVTAMPGWA